jgi:hypothetical protein
MKRHFGLYLHIRGRKPAEHQTRVKLVARQVPQAGFMFGWFSALKLEVIRSSETSVHIRNTQRYIPEDEKHALLPL